MSDAPYVKSLPVWHKVFRSCFLGALVQFAKVLAADVVVALTNEFFKALEVAVLRESYPICFNRVTSQEHSTNGVFRQMTLANSIKYTNPGCEKHNCQPEL